MTMPSETERVQQLIEQLTPDCGQEKAKFIENGIHEAVRGYPEILLFFGHHEQACVREAVAVVAGRLFDAGSDSANLLRDLLEKLSADPDKWVRIKAHRALTGGLADAEKMSPLANCCISLHNAAKAGKPPAELRRLADEVEGALRRKIMRRRPPRTRPFDLTSNGLLSNEPDDLLRFFAIAAGGAPSELWENDIDLAPGWKGDELRVLVVRRFSPLICSFAVWPRRQRDIYACGAWRHDDSPDDFALWHRNLPTLKEAENAIEQMSGEADCRSSPGNGWQEVVRWT